MIKRALELCHRIDAFCAVNQWPVKRNRDENDDDGSVCWDTLTPDDWDTLKELYNLTRPFQDFTACIEGHATTGLYKALWEVLPAIELLVSEYKRFAKQYTTLALSNEGSEVEKENSDMEYSHILLCINNVLHKLIKYQGLLPHFLAYAAAVAMNPILRWHWMKSKAPHLFESLKAAVLNLLEGDYNSKVPPKPTIGMPLSLAEERSTFDNFLQADKNFFLFDATAPIDRYHDYCSTCLTLFSECSDIVVWWDTCGTKNDLVSLMVWDIIAIPAMSSECKRVFSNAGCLITLLQNRLKKDIIEACECLGAWYKQEPSL